MGSWEIEECGGGRGGELANFNPTTYTNIFLPRTEDLRGDSLLDLVSRKDIFAGGRTRTMGQSFSVGVHRLRPSLCSLSRNNVDARSHPPPPPSRSGWIVSLMVFNIRMRSGDDKCEILRSTGEMSFDIRSGRDFSFEE